jgi:hypothetical protein
MPFILITVGILMMVVAIRNSQSALGAQIVKDFTGQSNFFYWIVAIFILGAIGYIDELKGPSRAMLALVIVALILSNRGFFNSFVSQLKTGSAQAPPGPTPAQAGASGGSSVGSAIGNIKRQI